MGASWTSIWFVAPLNSVIWGVIGTIEVFEFNCIRCIILVSRCKDCKYFHRWHIFPLGMKGCMCHFVKWQIHPFISKVTYLSKPCVFQINHWEQRPRPLSPTAVSPRAPYSRAESKPSICPLISEQLLPYDSAWRNIKLSCRAKKMVTFHYSSV